MRDLKLNSFSIVSLALLIAFFISSCSQEIAVTENTLETSYELQKRSIGCPEPKISLEIVPDSPCAKVKFWYNGTSEPNSNCTLKNYNIKIWRTWDRENVKVFSSPLINTTGPLGHIEAAYWVSTLNGNLVRHVGSPSYFQQIPSPITDANGKFDIWISNDVNLGWKVWVCVEIEMECDGISCPTYSKCIDAFLPCI